MGSEVVMKMLCATAEAIGAQITPSAAALMASDLSDYGLQDISLALAEVRRTARGRLVVGDVLRVLAATDGRPGRDEAWAIALSATDEDDTVVMTDEIQLALAAARPVLEAGDKVGARMAFLSAYDRFIDEARREAAPVNWLVSLGYDAGRRDVAITRAVQLKRLPQEKAQLYLCQDMAEKPTNDGRAIAGLITGTKSPEPSPEVKSKLQAIKESIEAAKKKAEQKVDYDAAERRADHERRLAAHNALLAKAMAKGEHND
jgi:hypothetical protein